LSEKQTNKTDIIEISNGKGYSIEYISICSKSPSTKEY
jgi:hypothetical protein